MKRSSSHQEASTAWRPQSTGSDIPTAPHTAPLHSAATFGFEQVSTTDLLDISTLNMDFSVCGNGYNSSNYSPLTCRTSPADSSMQSSPELAPISLFGGLSVRAPRLPPSHQGATCPSPTSPRGHSPKKKSLQLPDDMIIAETGVSNEEVEAFIQGPDPITKDYTCLYEGCKFKPFARKENIRSHIQTHLGDRKFVCGTCKSRFVRPNDLKRHSVIHQSFRDFVCICGAAFGRKDALRRHKLRNEKCARDEPHLQVLKKEEKKRGRPRKVAPTETAERRERKERIRKQVMHKKREGSVPSSVATSYSSPDAEMSSPEPYEMQPVLQDYSPSMEMAFTPPASPQDVIINPCLTLQQPSSFTSGDNFSPPPTRGSMTGGLKSSFLSGNDQQTVEVVGLSGSDDFASDPFSLPAPGSQSQTYSSRCGSPPELDQLSSSPEPSGFKPSDGSLDGFRSQLGEAANFDDFNFGSTSRAGPDDMFSLFGDSHSGHDLGKTDSGLQGFENPQRDDSFWASF